MKNASTLLLVLLLGCGSLLSQSITLGPYLQSPTQTSIKVKWRTATASASTIMYGTSPTSLTQSATDPAPATWHTVQVTGLQPDTRYYYAVYNDSTFAEGGDSLHTFRTWPAAGANTHVRAWAIGDFGKANTTERRVRDSWAAFEANETEETDLWLWMGDNAYDNGTEAEYQTKVFDSIYGYAQYMKRMPFHPCPGNHDYNTISPVQNPQPPLQHTGPYFDLVDVYQNGEAGGLATGHELFYSYDYGNVHFVSLNSELGSLFSAADDWIGIYLFGSFSGSPMTQWLHADLTANTKPWTVVYFHQPPYTDGSHDASQFWEVYMQAMRENFAEIWEQYGVDLVICGHSHVYERSYLVHGAYQDASQITQSNFIQQTSGVEAVGEAYTKYTQGPGANVGTVYVVQGNSGSVDAAPSFQHPYMYSEFGCDSCAGSFVLDVDSNRLDGRHLDMNGNIVDHFTILKTFGPVGVEERGPSLACAVSPNPFRQSAELTFELPEAAQVHVRLTDMLGSASVTAFAGALGAGSHKVPLDPVALKLARGTYVLTLQAGDLRSSKMVVFD